MHFRICFTLLILIAVPALAQVPTDTSRAARIEFELSLGATQSASSENWEGGEYGNLAWISDLRARVEKPLSRIWDMTSELKISFGQEHRHVEDTESWSVPKRIADRLRGDAMLLYTHGWSVDPYLAVSAESQFSDESHRKRRHFNPIDLTESAGVARHIVNQTGHAVILTRLGVGIRQHFHIVEDPLDPNLTTYESQKDGGVEWVTDVEMGAVNGRYSYVSKVTLFQALYTNLPSKNASWQRLDFAWDNTLRLYNARWLQASLNWQWLFDQQISARGRFMEMVSVSLAYRFSR